MQNWYDKYTTPEWDKKFRKQAKDIFSKHPDMIDDAFQAGWERLLKKLPSLPPDKITDSYIMTVYKRMIIDEYRHHFGRCEPYAWVKKLGGFWAQVAKMLCRTGESAEGIANKIQPDSSEDIEERTHIESVRLIVNRLQARPYCSTLGERENPSDSVEDSVAASTQDKLSETELSYLLQIILDGPSQGKEKDMTAHIMAQRNALSEQLNATFSESDWIILRTIFSEGKKIPFVAKALNKTEVQIRYRLKQLLKTLQTVLIQFDIDLSSLND